MAWATGTPTGASDGRSKATPPARSLRLAEVEDVRRLLKPLIERVVRDRLEDPFGRSGEGLLRLPHRDADEATAALVPPRADLNEPGGALRGLVDSAHGGEQIS